MKCKKHKKYQLMAEAYARTEGLYNAQLTFINVANSKKAYFSTGCFKFF